MKGKKLIQTLAAAVLAAALMVTAVAADPIDAEAAHSIIATVNGTVASGTDGSILYLDTKDGKMTIKIDSDTNTSGCKLMLPGSTVYASVYYGSDAYLHADTLSSSSSMTSTTTGSKTYSVSGSIANKSMNGNIMYVNLSTSGEMQVKIDSTTTYNCGPLYAGKGITMTVVRGDDAYMHAVTISDASAYNTTVTGSAVITSSDQSSASGTASGSTVPETASNGAKITPVTGVVNSSTKAGTGIVYITGAEGTYTLKLDSTTGYSNGFLLIPGQKVTANIYRGDDAYMHVYSFKRAAAQSAASTGTTQMTFTGTVTDKTTESVLYLNTSGGTMTIKLDSSTSYSGTSPVYVGSKVSAVCTNCSDEYWHANSISLTN